MKIMTNLFVYGTLMYPEVVKALTGKKFDTVDATLYGHVVKEHIIELVDLTQDPGEFELDGAKSYISISSKTGSSVKGKIMLNVDEISIDKIAFFEGKDFKFKTVFPHSNQVIIAKTFEWKYQTKFTANWSPEEFRKYDLEHYIKTVVIPSKQEYLAKHF